MVRKARPLVCVPTERLFFLSTHAPRVDGAQRRHSPQPDFCRNILLSARPKKSARMPATIQLAAFMASSPLKTQDGAYREDGKARKPGNKALHDNHGTGPAGSQLALDGGN